MANFLNEKLCFGAVSINMHASVSHFDGSEHVLNEGDF